MANKKEKQETNLKLRGMGLPPGIKEAVDEKLRRIEQKMRIKEIRVYFRPYKEDYWDYSRVYELCISAYGISLLPDEEIIARRMQDRGEGLTEGDFVILRYDRYIGNRKTDDRNFVSCAKEVVKHLKKEYEDVRIISNLRKRWK